MSSSDEGNDIFLTPNTFRQNVNESMDSDVACNAAEMLFNLNDDLLENICMDPLKSDNTLHYAENLAGKPTTSTSDRWDIVDSVDICPQTKISTVL